MTDQTDDTKSGGNRVGRRPFLLGVTATAAAAGAAGVPSVFADEEDDEHEDESKSEGEGEDQAAATQEAGAARGARDEAFAWDSTFDMQLTNRMQLDGDPAGNGRENVVHITSHGEESDDYSCAAVDLQDRSLTIGDVSGEGSITYDYLKGSQASYRVPDEVFLIVRRAQQRGLAVIYRKEDTETTDQWETRDVSSEFDSDGWRLLEVDDETVDVEGEKVTVPTKAITKNFREIREQDSSKSLSEQLDDGAEVLALAVGNGSIEGTVSDAYFADLQIGGEPYVIPAMLGMDVEFSPRRVQPGGGNFAAWLSFANGDEEGLTLDDIDGESVRMAAFSSIAPPAPGTPEAEAAVSADRLRTVSDRGAAIEFDASSVAELVGDDSKTVCLYGDFDVEEPYTFAAVSTLERGGGRGN